MMSNEIIKVLDDLGRRMGIAIDWSSKNVMPYIEELANRFIKWVVTTSCVWLVVGIVMIVAGTIVATTIWRRRDSYDYFGDIEEIETWFFVFGILFAIMGIVVVLVQCFDIAEAIYLPELTIYHYIKHLID